ncbi:MAG: 23S rRNA pseudouridine(1911/1915/1917) synthase RluD [Gammaproteobacteria bacterium]|nr:23S rRNA pseudouridine(1911/1915/1917) synthase RluD [Gammaproteobacteria bacterium]MYD75229.1 23S rRNA pseudouridine(1911/1915/1917) synthase RluD [Gammaproteobacteria bacterium]MYJ51706.1 23S rRNA pseudouridine(1911/1915/1917) synthase RluD [Gammaproteobacteria bacterium]
MSDTDFHVHLTVPDDAGGQRLDSTLAEMLPEYSRTTVQSWIQNGQVTVDGRAVKRKYPLSGNEVLSVRISPREPLAVEPEQIELDVLWADDQLIVLNKQAGLVVHPGAGNLRGTLLNGLLHHFPDLTHLPRGGIVHRLDKDTTGILVVSRTEHARQRLISQLADRTMRRVYQAVCEGVMIAGSVIDKPIGRHPHDRLRMSVTSRGKPAVTRLSVIEKFRAHSLVEASLETGRTHQIRVHMNSIGHPLVGDGRYGSRGRLPQRAPEQLVRCLREFDRQALHAGGLSLTHPETGRVQSWRAEPPEDFQKLVNRLRHDSRQFDSDP